MSANCGWLYPNQQFPTKPYYSCQAVFFRKVASADEKGKENIQYFLDLSGKSVEFAIIIYLFL